MTIAYINGTDLCLVSGTWLRTPTSRRALGRHLALCLLLLLGVEGQPWTGLRSLTPVPFHLHWEDGVPFSEHTNSGGLGCFCPKSPGKTASRLGVSFSELQSPGGS